MTRPPMQDESTILTFEAPEQERIEFEPVESESLESPTAHPEPPPEASAKALDKSSGKSSVKSEGKASSKSSRRATSKASIKSAASGELAELEPADPLSANSLASEVIDADAPSVDALSADALNAELEHTFPEVEAEANLEIDTGDVAGADFDAQNCAAESAQEFQPLDMGQPGPGAGNSLATQIEAILYLKAQPLTLAAIAELVGCNKKTAEAGLMDLIGDYAHRETALEIAETSTGYSLQLKEAFHGLVQHLVPVDLGVAALRTLATIALRGPISQTDLVDFRGSGVYDHVKELVEQGFVSKRRQANGRSFWLQVTDQFYQYFQVQGIPELKLTAKGAQRQAEAKAKADAAKAVMAAETAVQQVELFTDAPSAETPEAETPVPEAELEQPPVEELTGEQVEESVETLPENSLEQPEETAPEEFPEAVLEVDSEAVSEAVSELKPLDDCST
jgi:segregation and condensation protein B